MLDLSLLKGFKKSSDAISYSPSTLSVLETLIDKLKFLSTPNALLNSDLIQKQMVSFLKEFYTIDLNALPYPLVNSLFYIINNNKDKDSDACYLIIGPIAVNVKNLSFSCYNSIAWRATVRYNLSVEEALTFCKHNLESSMGFFRTKYNNALKFKSESYVDVLNYYILSYLGCAEVLKMFNKNKIGGAC